MRRQGTLKARLIFTMMVLVFATTLSLSLIFFYSERSSLEENSRDEMLQLGEIMATNTASSLLFDDAASAYEILTSLQSRADIVNATIFNLQAAPFVE